MANVINRTTLEYKTSVNTPDFPTETWIINPDLSPVAGVPTKYWKIVGDSVLPMTNGERATVDLSFNTASGVAFQQSILNVIAPDPFLGVSGTVVVSGGLNLVTNVPNLIVNDVTPVVASTLGTKNVLISIVYNTVSGTFGVVAREKVAENYAEILTKEVFTKELFTKDLAEFYVVASGTTLVKV